MKTIHTKQRAVTLAAAVAVAVIALAGCNKAGSSTSAGGTFAGNDPILSVNGTSVPKSVFYLDMQTWRPNPQLPSGAITAGQAVLSALIQNALVEQMAQKNAVYPTKEQIDDQFNSYKLVQESSTTESLDQQLADAGLTADSYKLLQIVPQLCQINLLAQGMNITDADVKAYYDLHKDDKFTRPDRAHVKRMVLASEADAKAVYDKINNGASFTDLYSQSIDKQLTNGELPQWLPLDDASNPMTIPLIDAIKATAVGKVTKPVPFQGGWWIVDVVDKKKKDTWTFDQVKSAARFAMLQEKIQADTARMQKFQEDLRTAVMAANIQVDEPQYADLVSKLKNPPPIPQIAPPTAAPPPAAMPSTPPTMPAKPAAPDAGAQKH